MVRKSYDEEYLYFNSNQTHSLPRQDSYKESKRHTGTSISRYSPTYLPYSTFKVNIEDLVVYTTNNVDDEADVDANDDDYNFDKDSDESMTNTTVTCRQ